MSNYQQHPIHPPMGNQPPWPPQGQPGPSPVLPPNKPGQGGTWWKSRPIIGGAALVLGVVIGAAGGNGNSATSTAAGSTPTVTVSVPADGGAPAAPVTVTAPPPAAKTVQVPGPVKTVTAPPAAPAAAIADDGIWLVGTDVKPGTYRSSSGGDCYWARLKNTSGDFEGIITNGTGANQVVTVKKTDKAFESTRCAPWTRIR